jgi:hypothetical protein
LKVLSEVGAASADRAVQRATTRNIGVL